MKKDAKILVIGDKILPGKGMIAFLRKQGFTRVLSETSVGLDLLCQKSVTTFFLKEQPEYVFLGYIKAGGIGANLKYPADFIYENLEAQNNVIQAAFKNKVKKLLFYGSSCAYPKKCPQPIKEEYLLEGALEKTSQPYAISKIAGIEMCRSYRQQYGTDFFSLMPATIYGPGDDFNLESGHVIPSLIKRFHEAKIEKSGDLVTFNVVANSFLPHQVRNMVGALIKIGLGKMTANEFHNIIEARRPGLAGPTAPACGLCLMQVNYPRPLGEEI